MQAPQDNLPVKMIRANLAGLPGVVLPDGFALRWYQPGDETQWLRIQRAAERFLEITPELFGSQFGGDEERGLQPALGCANRSRMSFALQDLRDRQCYLLDPRGELIGTGTAWFDKILAEGLVPTRPPLTPALSPSEGQGESPGRTLGLMAARWGRVHWMAILPEYQGRGLGKVLLTTICRRLSDLGHKQAYLHTSVARIPALKLYLRFGFEPAVRNAEEQAAWQNVFAALQRTR